MNIPILQADNAEVFIKFSEDISAFTKKTAESVDNFRKAYHDISRAIINAPTTIDGDNVVRQGLVENRLRRDIETVRSEMLRLQTILIESLKYIIQSSNGALCASYHRIQVTSENQSEFDIAKSKLIENIYLLENLELGLRMIHDS